jgi:hypothetical protein
VISMAAQSPPAGGFSDLCNYVQQSRVSCPPALRKVYSVDRTQTNSATPDSAGATSDFMHDQLVNILFIPVYPAFALRALLLPSITRA